MENEKWWGQRWDQVGMGKCHNFFCVYISHIDFLWTGSLCFVLHSVSPLLINYLKYIRFRPAFQLWFVTIFIFSSDKNVNLTVFEDLSHFGYKIDTRDLSQLYKEAEMPDELIDIIVQTISMKQWRGSLRKWINDREIEIF